ncbi:MAG: 50S ribosomal protein L18 [Chloroflexota bacterium]|nr:50S ribosomal protein L18 [Chloroflexota bacterium]
MAATTKQLKKKRALRTKRQLRIRARIEGTPERPRLAVFRSLTNIYAQVIDDEAGKTLVSASSVDKEIAPTLDGKTKVEVAKLVGQALASRAVAAGISAVVFDRGGFKYHGRVAALAEGAREGGLNF